jgi:beta-lactamase regulating signal transducer with metallopeptidase domain
MMDLPPNAWIEGVLWLLQVSFQAAIVVAAILVIRRLAGGRLSAQWRHALWFVLLLRLLLPWTPHSAVSLYQVVPNPVETLRTENPIPVAEPRLSPSMKTAEAAATHRETEISGGPMEGPGLAIAVVWLLGAALVGSWILIQTISIALALRGRRALTDQSVLEVLEDC